MVDQSDLFAPAGAPDGADQRPARVRAAPLSNRMRPRTVDEYVGQGHIVGPGTVLRGALDADRMPSLILYGPPGSGKTTLAMIVAASTKAAFEPVSATSAGVADLRRIVGRAEQRRRIGQATVMFIDEIHRFNKGQQDAVLPHVENGTVQLLGATTENPSFQVNAALLSRARVVPLEPLSAADLRVLIDRALGDAERGLGTLDVTIADDVASELTRLSGGDARIALDALEIAAYAATEAARTGITLEDVHGALQSPALLHDRVGDQHFWVVSAFIKSMRGSDPDASVYWLARMLEAGEDPMFCARRMVLFAAEDIGLADPQALVIAVAAQQATHVIGMPESYLPLTESALYLALAPKSNSVYRTYGAARDDVAATLAQPVPLHLRNASGGVGRQLGFGAGYQYAHDFADAVVDQEHLPAELRGRHYYEPGERGAEAAMSERMRTRGRRPG